MRADADEVLGQREPLSTIGGNVDGWSHYGNQCEG